MVGVSSRATMVHFQVADPLAVLVWEMVHYIQVVHGPGKPMKLDGIAWGKNRLMRTENIGS